MERVSVVVPVYNEEGVIAILVRDLEETLPTLARDYEAVIVDDASTDETPGILDDLAGTRPWLCVHHSEQNGGHGASVMRGLDLATGDWILQIDSDGQFAVSEFERLWQRRDECDVALGVRAERSDPRHRLLLTRAVQLAASLLAGRRIRDVNTPFRLVRASVWQDCRAFMAPDTLAPNVLVTLGAVVRGWQVVEVPVTHLARERSTSTLRHLRLIRFSVRGLGQLVAFRRRLAGEPGGTPIPAGKHA